MSGLWDWLELQLGVTGRVVVQAVVYATLIGLCWWYWDAPLPPMPYFRI